MRRYPGTGCLEVSPDTIVNALIPVPGVIVPEIINIIMIVWTTGTIVDTCNYTRYNCTSAQVPGYRGYRVPVQLFMHNCTVYTYLHIQIVGSSIQYKIVGSPQQQQQQQQQQ